MTCRDVRVWLAASLVVLSTVVFSTLPAWSAEPRKPPKGNCGRCHELATKLPEKHPKVKGESVAACIACHKPKVGDPGPNAFAARMHRAHVASGVECTTCHVYRAGQQFSVAGSKGNLGAFSGEEYNRVRKAMTAWVDSPYLASLHGVKGQLTCTACHAGQLIPDDNETILNARCVACHGAGAQMAEKTKGRHGDINVHASHLGNISCTVCHQGHSESKTYCLHCHTNFDMKIPGGATAAGK